jgi:hypothetical protein
MDHDTAYREATTAQFPNRRPARITANLNVSPVRDSSMGGDDFVHRVRVRVNVCIDAWLQTLVKVLVVRGDLFPESQNRA